MCVGGNMSKIHNENFINIQGWMVNELGLKGNCLLIYAIIYGFSQNEGNVFNGSLQYLADWTNSTKQGVLLNLKKLLESGLIGKNEKLINGVKFVEYYTTKFNGGIKESLIGIKQSLMNNKIDNIDNNIETNNIDKSILLGETPEYGNSEINNLFKEWETQCGFKIDSKVKLNRYACRRLIKSKGYENVLKVIPIVAISQEDKYAPGINNFMDLADKWNNLGVWYKKKKLTKDKKYVKIKISK